MAKKWHLFFQLFLYAEVLSGIGPLLPPMLGQRCPPDTPEIACAKGKGLATQGLQHDFRYLA